MRTLLLRSVLGLALLAGPACKAAEAPVEVYQAYAYSGNVIPAPTPATSAWASVIVAFNSARLGYAYSAYSVGLVPIGTIDSIALYQVAAGDPLPASASAILCAGVAACAATGGYAMVVPPATAATIPTSIRANGMQAVFFTTTAQRPPAAPCAGRCSWFHSVVVRDSEQENQPKECH